MGQQTIELEKENTLETQDAAKEGRKRDGHTKAHYDKQKGQQYAYFRIRTDDVPKMKAFQFSIYDFITNSFAFSQTKKELAIAVLEALKAEPLEFIQLQKKLNAKKSTLYLLVLSLQRSGLVSKGGKNEKLEISGEFGEALKQYALWWEKWQHE